MDGYFNKINKLVNTSNLIVQNVRIVNHQGNKNPIVIRNCNGLIIQNVSIQNSSSNKEGILVENCEDVRIDGVSFSGNVENLSGGVVFRIDKNRTFKNVRITNVLALAIQNKGIILKKEKNAALENYIVNDNIAIIKDLIKGKNARIENNF